MCLTSCFDEKVRKKIERKIERHPRHKYLKIGYKIFTTDGEEFYLPYTQYDDVIKQKRWLNEKEFRLNPKEKTIRATNLTQYRTGFHLFLRQDDAKTFAKVWWYAIKRFRENGAFICRVYFDEVTRYGRQESRTVVVAKKIYIPKKCVMDKVTR
jgi:hypothetical protein